MTSSSAFFLNDFYLFGWISLGADETSLSLHSPATAGLFEESRFTRPVLSAFSDLFTWKRRDFASLSFPFLAREEALFVTRALSPTSSSKRR